MSVPDWDNEGVREGTRKMLDLRARALDRGERPIGWKLGFGAPQSMARFGLSGPLVGFLTDATAHSPGSTVSCAGWQRPVVEPEIAVYIGSDLESGSDDAADAIAALGPALELADVHPPPDDLEEILAGNIFHRGVVLGEPDPSRAGARRSDLRARVLQDGDEVVDTSDLETNTGDLVEIVAHCATLLGTAGARLAAGDVVIIGSVVPPLAIEPGQEIEFELNPLPAISVHV
jgi:2-keto-4-pentenoate hydratase